MALRLDEVRGLAVLGLGRSGRPATLLVRRKLSGARVWALDEGEVARETRAELEAAGATVVAGPALVDPSGAVAWPDEVELLVKSPGVPHESPVLGEARRRGVPVWSEVELASRFLSSRMIGITGTNGKTTTTSLTGRILEDAGVPVAVAGNIGHALAHLPFEVGPEAVVVAELSSFQLEDIDEFRPDVAVLLNLTEDHVDRHAGYAGYVAAKLRVFENQRAEDVAMLNADDPGTLAEEIPGAGRRAWFATAAAGGAGGEEAAGRAEAVELAAGVTDGRLWVAIAGRRDDLCAVEELSLKGEHNLQNSLAAAAAAAAVGVPAAAIAATLRTFAPVEHRLQIAAVVDGVTYVNDSKATNIDATLKALTAYYGPVYLILGGSSKGADFGPLARAAEGRVRQAVLIGAEAPAIAAAFARRAAEAPSTAVPSVVVPDLAAAVSWCAERARDGDVVLLSPACASFDQYRSYEHRGEHFLELVSKLEQRR